MSYRRDNYEYESLVKTRNDHVSDGAGLGANRVALRLEDSFGLAAQARVDIPLNARWSLNMGVWWVDINTTAKVKTDVGTVKFDVELDPMVYNIGIAYRF